MRFVVSVLFGILLSSFAKADWKVGLQVGYSPNYLVSLSGTSFSGGIPYAISYNLEYEAAAEFGINLWKTKPHSWGFISGFQFGAERKLQKGSINGISISASSDTSKYQTHFLYAGTLYRWESFYIPLAITYGITKFTAATTVESLEVKNGVGALLGLGWFFTDSLAIEYIGRSASTELNMSNGTDQSNTNGMISSALLNLKYFF